VQKSVKSSKACPSSILSADVATAEELSTCAKYSVGLEDINSLAIDLGFDMLSEMPAIIARRTSGPPLMLRTCLEIAGVFLDYAHRRYRATPGIILNHVADVI
jgi:hypothetical protein